MPKPNGTRRGKRSRRPKANPWVAHVQAFALLHAMPYGRALRLAKPSYYRAATGEAPVSDCTRRELKQTKKLISSPCSLTINIGHGFEQDWGGVSLSHAASSQFFDKIEINLREDYSEDYKTSIRAKVDENLRDKFNLHDLFGNSKYRQLTTFERIEVVEFDGTSGVAKLNLYPPSWATAHKAEDQTA